MAFFLAAFFAWLGTAAASTIISIGLTIVSAMYQRRRQKKMEAEMDKQKGFDLVVDGEPIHLPRVYGHQKIGGVRTHHQTFKEITTGNTGGTNFEQWRYPSDAFPDDGADEGNPSWNAFTSSTSKNSYLITQQALCMGGIDSVIDIEVNSKSWDSGKFKHLLEFDLSGDGVASPTATASGVVDTNKFTNCAWLSAVYWLNRNDYNYQGVPNLSAFVKGQKVWNIVDGSTLSDSKSFSNNNAECLLDYMLAPKALGGVGLSGQTVAEWLSDTPVVLTNLPINLASFYYAKQICDTVVSTQSNPKGRVNGMADIDRIIEEETLPTSGNTAGETVWLRSENETYERNQANNAWNQVTVPDRVIKLYECNLTIDTGRPLRDNLELFLETMGEAELVYSEGVYKLLLEYPTSDAEQDAVITATYDDSYIVNDEVNVSYANASERWNRVTIKFNNEETDFTADSVSWPDFGDANHVALLAEDAGQPSETEIFVPGVTHRDLALAKAENMVRSSRIMVGNEEETPNSVYSGNQKVVQLTLDKRAIIHDVGDLIKLSCVDADISNEVYRIQELNYVSEQMNVEVILTRFNHTSLAYSDKVTLVVEPKVTWDDAVPNVEALAWNDKREFRAKPVNGYLSWDLPDELDSDEVDKFLIYTSTDAETWEKIGSTSTKKFGIPSSFEDGNRYFLVRVKNSAGVMSAGTTILVTALVGIVPLVGSTVLAATAADYIALSWNYPSDTITSQYKLYWSLTDTKPASEKETTVEQFFSATGLTASTKYYFWIDVVGDGGAEGLMTTSFNFTTAASTDVNDIFGDADNVANPTVTSTEASNGLATLKVDWTENTDENTADYVVSITENTNTTQYIVAGSPFEILSQRGASFSLNLTARNGAGISSTTSSDVAHTVWVDTDAPADVTGLAGTAGFDTMWLEWTASTESDFSHYIITTSDTATVPNDDTYDYISYGTSLAISNPANDTQYFWIKQVDTSGNLSASWNGSAGGSAGLSLTLTSLVEADIAGIVDAASFASDISPVGLVDTLPADNSTYDVVLLSTDDKLYRWNGTAWDVSTDGADIEANSITAGQIQAGALGATEIASRAIVTEKLVVTNYNNLIPNGNFQDAAGDVNNYWTVASNGTISVVEGNGREGSNTLALIKNNLTDSFSPYISDDYRTPVKPSTEYVCSTSVKADFVGGVSNGFYCRVYYFNAAGAAITSPVQFTNVASNGPAGDDWTDYSVTLTTPDDCASVRIRVWDHSSQTDTLTFWVDHITLLEKNAGSLIVDGGITADHVGTNEIIANAANIKDAVITNAKISELDAAKLTAGSVLTGSVVVGSNAISDIGDWADDPASRVNAGTTQIDPGKIVISGGTSLEDWRGTDTTTIDGGAIETNSVTATQIAADTITADQIAAGTITSNEVEAGFLNVASGNLLTNTNFEQGLAGWRVDAAGGDIGAGGASRLRGPNELWSPNAGYVLELSSSAQSTSDGYYRVFHSVENADGSAVNGGATSVEEGEWYEISAQVSTHSCGVRITAQWKDSTGSTIAMPVVDTDSSEVTGDRENPDLWRRIGGVIQAPAGTTGVRFVAQLYTNANNSGGGDSLFLVHKPMLRKSSQGAGFGPFAHGGETTIDGGKITTESVIASNFKSTNFDGTIAGGALTDSGSVGFAMSSDGDFVANNLIARESVIVGAVSDGVTYGNLTAQMLDHNDTVDPSTTLGVFTTGQFWQIAFNVKWRNRSNWGVYYNNKGGEGYDIFWTITRLFLQIRYKESGTWSSWETEATTAWSSAGSTAWMEEEYVISKMGVYDDVDIRILVGTSATLSATSSTDPGTTNYNNVDDVSMVARALVR